MNTTTGPAPLPRKSIYIKGELHAALARRNRDTGIPLQNLIDEALELGMRLKRWLPDESQTEAEAAA